METIQQEALLLEALSDKVLHQLPPAVWKQLFLGAGRDTIRFEQRHLALLHAEAATMDGQPGGATDGWHRELQRLSSRHDGRLDPYAQATALVTFEQPDAAVRMATELQQAAPDVVLRIGVVSGACTLAFFRALGRLWCTPLGEQTMRAGQVAATAQPGGIVISPEVCEPPVIRVRSAGYGQADFRDSELDLTSLALDIALEGVDIRC